MSVKKTIKDLNLMDSFLFNEMMNHEEREWFVSMLLERILGRNPGKVKVTSERMVPGKDADKHGIQIDAYIETEEDDSTVYDIEPNKYHIKKETLQKRARYYLSIVDSKLLESGEDYGRLKDSMIIFILPYDPFHRGKMKYTFKKKCIEYPDIPYDDGQTVIYLYTNGENDGTEYGKKLQHMLQYFENSSIAVAGEDEDLIKAQSMVDDIRNDSKRGGAYMTWADTLYFEREEGFRDGEIAGYKNGEIAGFKNGEIAGFKNGEIAGFKNGEIAGFKNGKDSLLEELIRKKLKKSKSVEEMADELEQDIETINSIIENIGNK